MAPTPTSLGVEILDADNGAEQIDASALAVLDHAAAWVLLVTATGSRDKACTLESLLGLVLKPSDLASGTITARTGAVDLSGGSDGDVLTVQADGSLAVETPAGGGGLEHFSESEATATPNNVVNNVCLAAVGDTSNISLSLKPKGNGPLCAAAPNGSATGGNIRGNYAVDWQLGRNAATQVASGAYSVLAGGLRNTSSAIYGVVSGGTQNAASGGNAPTVTGGNGNTASADFTRAGGFRAVANQYGMDCYSAGGFADFGSSDDCQVYKMQAKGKTDNSTPVRLQLNGINQTPIYPAIASGKVLLALVSIVGVKSDGSAVASYTRRLTVKNVGGSTSLVGSVVSIGTDQEDSATGVSISVDDTSDTLDISVTGIAAETWRWLASIEGVEITYGT